MNQPERDAELWRYVEAVRPRIERALLSHLPFAPAPVDPRFNEALRYALFPGGKRLRPVFTLLGAELVGGLHINVLRAATAVEYIHTSSLIFDDLPCMDNAAERRGRATLHKAFGEGLAILVALALMNASYGLVFDLDSAKHQYMIQAHGELVSCIGTNGMVTGQTVDLSPGNGGSNTALYDGHEAVRNLKTSALIRLALRLGAILSGAEARQLSALSDFAGLVGEAYQISDDVLDLTEDAALVAGARRATLAAERGAQDARLRIDSMTARAKEILVVEFGESRPARVLCQIADYIAGREA